MTSILLVASLLAVQSGPPVRPRAVAQQDYVIGPEDVIAIEVFGEEALTRKVKINPDGTFEFPYIGRIDSKGLTVRALEKLLVERLLKFYQNPQLSIEVLEYRSQTVYVTGEVAKQGSYSIQANMTLIEALAEAGGVRTTASNEVIIVRPKAGRSSTGPVLPGDADAAEVVRVNLREPQNVQLHDGETVYVPKAATVLVEGYVKSPGSYVIDQGTTTVLHAITLAGGLDPRGWYRGLKILRMVDGKLKEIDARQDTLVEPGDTIRVAQRWW
jgi:polysaccharide export outer membrane protein